MNTFFHPPSVTLERPLKLLMELVTSKLFKTLKRIKLMGGGRREDEVEKKDFCFS